MLLVLNHEYMKNTQVTCACIHVSLYTRTRVLIMHTHNIITYAQELRFSLNTFTVINLQFFSAFTFETTLTYSDQFTRQPLINVPIISTGYYRLDIFYETEWKKYKM